MKTEFDKRCEIQAAISEARGRQIYVADGNSAPAWCGGSKVHSAGGYYEMLGRQSEHDGLEIVRVVPGYLTDGGVSMRAALEELTDSEMAEYATHLYLIVVPEIERELGHFIRWDAAARLLRATLWQQAEAYLRTKGKWKEQWSR